MNLSSQSFSMKNSTLLTPGRSFKQMPKSQYPLQDFLNDVVKNEICEVGVYQLPGPKSNVGDDTYLISGMKISGNMVATNDVADGKTIAVFDGIGGNYSFGINPRDYSFSLMNGCKTAVDEKKLTDPLEVLEEGFIFASKIDGSR